MSIVVGTSGWQYRHWRETFYPRGLAQARWLEYFAERFQTVEINNTFYRLPERKVFEAWAARTPDDFVLAPKMSRYLTHIKRLREPEDSVRLFLERAEPLGSKTGPILLQLPPNFKVDVERLTDVVKVLPDRFRWTVEFRHASWYTDQVESLLRDHGVALCLADRLNQPVSPLWRTADWAYVRFHEGRASPRPCYGRQALDTWAGRIAERWPDDCDIYVYFNNDPLGCALRDARVFAIAMERHGYPVTRVPAASDISVG